MARTPASGVLSLVLKEATIDKRRQFGDAGEVLAVKHLKKKGYRIVEHGYKCRLGEIDIIAIMENTLVFCEVKTRRSTAFGKPFEAVNERKQQKIRKVADYYYSFKADRDLTVRFDVISIEPDGADYKLEHLENAFM